MAEVIKAGDRAPDFELAATTAESVRLSSALGAGPVLLLFYPLDWSPVCTSELCSLRADFNDYAGLGAAVFAISVDSIFSHKAFAAHHNISIPLLSDFNKTVSQAYGVLYPELMGLKGVAKRSAFLLDAKGIVRWVWVTEDPLQMPDFAEIKKQIEALQ
ncbi:MAG: peroxiredoxin [Deltaproteobacteria bacterium]|nr:peroxiredoxin [Deltaproteobacteria bacterium]